jgi:hypothetical protein
VDELYGLSGTLNDLSERFGVDFALTIASIESDIAEHEEFASYNNDERGGYSHGSNTLPDDLITEDDVRQMFKTLRG